MTATIVLPTYRVARVSAPGARNSYQVFVLQEDGAWEQASKEYEHSTSAFAALGRLVQKETLKRLADQEADKFQKENPGTYVTKKARDELARGMK